MKHCTHCNKPVERCQSELKKSKTGNVFCNKSCAASFNNKTPKRKSKTKCSVCSKQIRANAKYCGECYKKVHYLDDKTLEEATTHRSGSSRYINIRKAARRKYLKSDRIQCCHVCKYKRHFEVCHIKDIADFPLDSKIRDINDMKNLVSLCPTHHWELDNGFLGVECFDGHVTEVFVP